MATDITLRQTKGAPLTYDELDANFANLKETADLAYDAVAGVGGKANATAIGIAATDDDMGTTPGGILSDNGTAKTWFQESEAAIEARAPINNPTFTGTVAGVSKAMVGLSSVDNTSDVAKPVSTAQQAALDAKAPIASPTFTGTVGGITKSMVGLGNVDNTSDANKPVSTATQTALNAKENSLSAGTTAQYYRGDKSWQTLNSAAVGLANVDNTSDANKPVSTPQQTALNLKVSAATLALVTGGAGVGWQQSGTGGAATTLDAKMLQFMQTARDRGAAINGSTDARAALLAADAIGPFRLTPGLYYVASNTTIANKVVVDPGARFVIPNGVTLTFSSDIEAGDYQIFNLTGTGNAAGLKVAREAWFVGDLIGTTTDATSLIQKLDGATAASAFVFLHQGEICWTGAAYVTFTKGQHLVGSGMWGQTRYKWTTAPRFGIQFTTATGGSISGAHFVPNSTMDATIATAGSTIRFASGAAVNFTVSDLFIQGCFSGVQLLDGNSGSVRNVSVGDAVYTGFWTRNCYNVRFSDCHSSAFSDWAALSTTAGFQTGESITWSGGNGSYGYTLSGTVAKIFINSTTPANGTTITGATSGATATVTSITKGHQSGAVFIEGGLEANDFIGCSFAGGTYALYGRATSDAHGSRPEFCRFTSCYFDNSDGGADLQYCDSFIFVGCWFATRAGNGLTLRSCRGAQISSCQFVNCWHHGLSADIGCFSLMVTNSVATGNNKSNSSKDGINIAAGLTDFSITNNRCGGSWLANGGSQRYGIRVETGASDRYIITGNLMGGNANTGVFDGGSGVNKSIAANF